MPELYPDAVEGPYTVPSGTDIADGPQAFRDFADSLGGLSDTLEVFELAGDHTVTAVEMGGLFTHSGSGMTLTVNAGEHPVGSVMAVSNLSDEADAVVTVETPNLTETVGQYAIMSFTQVAVDVWVPNGGGAGGGGLLWAKDIDSEADLAGLDAEVVAAQEPDLTLWARCDTEPWRKVCDPDGPVVPGFATFNEAACTNVTFVTKADSTTGVQYRVGTWLQSGTLALSQTGVVEAFIVGGGGGGHSDQNPAAKNAGGGAGFLQGLLALTDTSNRVKVGNGGGGNSGGGSVGVASWIETYMAAGGRGGGGTNSCKSGNWNNGAGNSGGTGTNGGGAGAAATAGQSGDGVWNDWNGSGRWYGGGGASGRGDGDRPSSPSPNGGTPFRQSGAANSGAGAGSSAPPANGGSGIVIVRVPI